MRQIADKYGSPGMSRMICWGIPSRMHAVGRFPMLFVRATEVATDLSGVVGLRKVAWVGKVHFRPRFFVIGVDTFLPKDHGGDIVTEIELIRSTEGEKGRQIENVASYQRLRNTEA